MAFIPKPNQTHSHMSDDDAYLYASELVSLSIPCMVLMVTFELDLLEIIKKAGPEGTMAAAEVASHLPTTNPEAPENLDRILRFLASYSVVTCELRASADGKVERRYGLAPVCKYLTEDDEGASLAAIDQFMQSKIMIETWYSLKDVILDGGNPWKKTHKESLFEIFSKDPKYDAVFNKAMNDNTKIIMQKLLEIYDGFKNINSLVDVGGGHGIALKLIITKYPQIKGINYDQPHVVAKAKDYPGVEHVGGDMFVDIPRADAIFMKGIFHHWRDEQSIKVLKNCYNALPDDGKVIVLECVAPELPENSLENKFVFMLDTFSMTSSEGGKERTEVEWKELAKKAGFETVEIACKAYSFRAIEIIKRR